MYEENLRLGIRVNASNLSIWKVKAGASGVKSQFTLRIKFETNQLEILEIL